MNLDPLQIERSSMEIERDEARHLTQRAFVASAAREKRKREKRAKRKTSKKENEASNVGRFLSDAPQGTTQALVREPTRTYASTTRSRIATRASQGPSELGSGRQAVRHPYSKR